MTSVIKIHLGSNNIGQPCYGMKSGASVFYYSLCPSCNWFAVDLYSCRFFLHRHLSIYGTVVRYHFLDFINLLSHPTDTYLLRRWLTASFPLITHPSTTFHHIPESGLCTYLRSTNTASLCNNNSKLELLSRATQSHTLLSLAPRPLVVVAYMRLLSCLSLPAIWWSLCIVCAHHLSPPDSSMPNHWQHYHHHHRCSLSVTLSTSTTILFPPQIYLRLLTVDHRLLQ